MLVLNLVSDELKKEIKFRHLYQLIKKINFIFIILTIIIAIILLVARIILQNNFNKVVEQTTLVTRSNQSYNNKIREINSKLNFTENIQKDFISWSSLIEDLAKITPADVTFYFVKINYSDQTLKLKGRAAQRDSLLTLKNEMENSNLYQDLQFPLKNILEKTNVEFEIEVKLNLENLKK